MCPSEHAHKGDIFSRAEWYDRTINWCARMGRELPVLKSVFGAPGEGGIVDAGCGTGRHAIALAGEGYRVTGADAGKEMLAVARRQSSEAAGQVEFVHAAYAEMHDKLGGGFDGLCCLGNALSAAGSADAAKTAIEQFASCLRPGGRLFIQILNFAPMRKENPCIRGPRVAHVDGREHISVRQFHFSPDSVQVTNITIFNDGEWRKSARHGILYPIASDELQAWCHDADIEVDELWGNYAQAPFAEDQPGDQILVGTKRVKA